MQKLRELGFAQTWNSGYTDSDPSVRTVMEFTMGDVQIHIQMIKSIWFDKKVAAQAKIEEMYSLIPDRMRTMTKEDMKIVWRHVIARHA